MAANKRARDRSDPKRASEIVARSIKKRRAEDAAIDEKYRADRKRRTARWLANPENRGRARAAARARYQIRRREILDRQKSYDRGSFYAMQRYCAKRRAMPAWADKAAILAIYQEARRLTKLTGIEHHVDHIIPLQHELVCGLHVETNLQILTGYDNRAKGNAFDPLADWIEAQLLQSLDHEPADSLGA